MIREITWECSNCGNSGSFATADPDIEIQVIEDHLRKVPTCPGFALECISELVELAAIQARDLL